MCAGVIESFGKVEIIFLKRYCGRISANFSYEQFAAGL